jgi:hypothetical protein
MLVVAVSVAAVTGWVLLYLSENDPKNIKYILRKINLFGMDVDAATGTMIGDPGREKLVFEKTRVQLQEKFGYLLTVKDASPYWRSCYRNSAWKARNVLFIRMSPWMVVFDGDKATELVLIKGC